MSTVTIFPTEREAAAQAIAAIEAGEPDLAALLLKRALCRGRQRAGQPGPPLAVRRLRGYLERALVELTHRRGGAGFALATLRAALARPGA